MAAPNNPSTPDTIHALSSGRPPAAIAIVRVSGRGAGAILAALAGGVPTPRRAGLRTLRDRDGDVLDHALVLWFLGPDSATGEDLAELHLHGGRAVVDAVLGALTERGSRPAEPGEFTRRALLNGRLDLDGVEGLADLLAAETDYQRKEALRRSQGLLGRKLEQWGAAILAIAARLEAAIDYDGDIDGADILDQTGAIAALDSDIGTLLARVPAERLRDGLRVAIIGPVNAGKSSLFNALVGAEAAIVSDRPGTTRDLIERPVSIAGIPFVLCDTAGLREADDAIERIGVARARQARDTADILLCLEAGTDDPRAIQVSAKADAAPPRAGAIATSARTGEGLRTLADAIVARARTILPGEGEAALNLRYREALGETRDELHAATATEDPVLVAEHLRRARMAIDRVTGTSGVEDMLEALFSRFCLGK